MPSTISRAFAASLFVVALSFAAQALAAAPPRVLIVVGPSKHPPGTHEVLAGFTPVTNLFWSYYYVACGLHGLHVIAGMVIMAIVAADARRGRNLHRVELIGIYWHFVDVVWIFLFPLFYIAK